MFMSAIHFIGGEKGGVGKSVVARLLSQFCIDKNLPFAAFDADTSHGALRRFYDGYCRPVDFASFESADAIFAQASEENLRILVDLPAQSDRMLGQWLEATGIVSLAGESGIPLVFWHVMDDGKDSVGLLASLLARHGERASYCIVKNLGRGKDFSLFDSSPAKAEAQRLKATIIELPELHRPAMQKIDQLDASFWAAANGSGDNDLPRLDRQRVRVWLYRVYERLASVPHLL
jgi:hypothetical protein